MADKTFWLIHGICSVATSRNNSSFRVIYVHDIVSHIYEYLDVSCPLKLMKFAKKKEDWLNNEILELIYERREVMKEFEKKKKITCCLSRVSRYATEYRLG